MVNIIMGRSGATFALQRNRLVKSLSQNGWELKYVEKSKVIWASRNEFIIKIGKESYELYHKVSGAGMVSVKEVPYGKRQSGTLNRLVNRMKRR